MLKEVVSETKQEVDFIRTIDGEAEFGFILVLVVLLLFFHSSKKHLSCKFISLRGKYILVINFSSDKDKIGKISNLSGSTML